MFLSLFSFSALFSHLFALSLVFQVVHFAFLINLLFLFLPRLLANPLEGPACCSTGRDPASPSMEGGQTSSNPAPAGNSSDFVSSRETQVLCHC